MDEPKHHHIPTLVARKDGQTIRIFPLSHLTLRNGTTIFPQYAGWTRRRIDLNGADAGSANLMMLAEYGMVCDLPCFSLTTDGEAIGEPRYVFQFIGVESQKTDRIDVITSEPFIIAVRG